MYAPSFCVNFKNNFRNNFKNKYLQSYSKILYSRAIKVSIELPLTTVLVLVREEKEIDRFKEQAPTYVQLLVRPDGLRNKNGYAR